MPDRLSPGSGGPLVDPDGRSWTMNRRKLDVRIVRRALKSPDGLVLLGETGGFDLRWVGPEQRPALWEQVRGRYRGAGGDINADFMAYEFVHADGGRLVYIELSC